MKVNVSVKHLQITKAGNTMFIAVAVAAAILVFSIVSAKSLLSESSYQRKALGLKHKAVKQLKANVAAANTLKQQYDVFEKQNPNIIGGRGGVDIAEALSQSGNSTGPLQINGQAVALGNQDGDNAKIILDALPSQYDYPALISSLEKVANLNSVPLDGVTGTDESESKSSTPTPGGLPQQDTIAYTITTRTDYVKLLDFVKNLERSIRPMDITNLSISGSADLMNANVQATTYDQAPVSLKIIQKEVK